MGYLVTGVVRPARLHLCEHGLAERCEVGGIDAFINCLLRQMQKRSLTQFVQWKTLKDGGCHNEPDTL
jgi:hypothetical protein